jgi:hypothetical protein
MGQCKGAHHENSQERQAQRIRKVCRALFGGVLIPGLLS